MLLTESPLQPIGLNNKTKLIIMGCVSSKAEHDAVAGFATNANLFQVMNVDDTGRRLCPGQLEVGESDLILYQRGKTPVRWPLRSLRRYGFDAQLFSFECGRRCPTGPGIYAFHCRNAEILFNHVQARVAARHEEQEQLAGVLGANGNHSRSRIRHSMPARSASSLLFPNSNAGNSLVVDREDVEENSYLEPIRLVGQQQQQGPAVWSPNSRPLSSSSLISSSSSPISPSAAGNLYANNEALLAAAAAANNDTGLIHHHHHHHDPSTMAMTSSVTMETVLVPPPIAYANLHHDVNNSNATAAKDPRLMMEDDLSADEADNQQHLYINVGPDAIEAKPRSSDSNHMTLPSLKQVNYVLLDLDKGSDSTTTASVTTTTGGGLQANSPEGSLASFPESPHRTVNSIAAVAANATTAITDVLSSSAQAVISAEGYATIDFDRTAALSNATGLGVAFPNLAGCEEEEQGLRKTRHNSTMVGGSSSSGSSHAVRLLGLNRQTSSVSE